MAFNPSKEVAVARDAAQRLNAQVGCVVIWVNRGTLGMASYGHTKAGCANMAKLGDELYEATMKHFGEGS